MPGAVHPGMKTHTLTTDDLHAVIGVLGGGPVEMFASSGGAVTALALVARHPGDVPVLVAHEPPLITLTPDGPAPPSGRRTSSAGGAPGWPPSSP